MEIPAADTPVACDMSTAPDTATERLAEYQHLFATHLIGRERTANGVVRFRLRCADGLEDQIRDLAAREHACCAFMAFEVTVVGDEIHWDAAVSDNPAARAILEEFYGLPDTAGQDPAGLAERYQDHGLTFVNGDPLKQ